MDIHAFIMLSCTLFVNCIILNIIGIGWFDSPQGPTQPGNGYSGTLRGQATCHRREMYDFVGLWRGFALLRVFKGETGGEFL
jgi:hypothetical protein